MAREASVGNGRMLVNLDEKGRIVDLYYPYVGMENHTSGKAQDIAVSIDGRLSWVEEWNTSMSYREGTMTVETTWSKKGEEVRLSSLDFVDRENTVFYRAFRLYNSSSSDRRVRVYFLHDIDLYGFPIGDTAFYDPVTKSIIHYKSKRYIGIKTMSISSPSFTSYMLGRRGVRKNVETGKLEGYSIAQGDVESLLSMEFRITPGSSTRFYYFIALSTSLKSLRQEIGAVDIPRIESSMSSTYQYWRSWLSRGAKVDEKIGDLFNVSLEVIRAHMDLNGSIIASSDYSFAHLYGDTYNYCWPRDAAYAAYALDIAGYGNLALRFADFVKDVMNEEGFLYHKYNPNKTLASSWHPWFYNGREILPIQEDETALPVWFIGNHYQIHGNLDEVEELYKKVVKPSVLFLMNYVEDGLPKPSFDLWEERYGIHIYTVASVYGALKKAFPLMRDMGDESLASDMLSVADQMREQVKKKMTYNGRFIRRLDEYGEKDLTVDSSSYATFFFEMFEPQDTLVQNTMNAVIEKLSVSGGIARYEDDQYRRTKSVPNPWVICTLWVAQYFASQGFRDEGLKRVKWVTSVAGRTGLLPEQVEPETLVPSSVKPLVWSHAEFVIASLALSKGK